jgi:hypothetical protein
MADRRVLLSQGEVRPGIMQGQHWGKRPPKGQVTFSSPVFRDASLHFRLHGSLWRDAVEPGSPRAWLER